MTLIDMDRGSIYITNQSFSSSNFDNDQIDDSNIIVRIDDQKGEEDFQNNIVEFNIPVTPKTKTTRAPDAQLIDLKRIKHIFSVQGKLSTGTTDAFTKKKRLKILAGYGNVTDDKQMIGETMKSGAVTVVRGWNSNESQEKFKGNIVKMKITEVPGKLLADGNTDFKTDLEYSVQVQISVGTERG